MKKICTFFWVLICIVGIIACGKQNISQDVAITSEEIEKSTMQKEEKIWTEQEIANMFYSMVNGENGIEYVDCTLMSDHSSACIGAVLFKNTEDGTTMVAFFDAEGFGHTCGTYAKVAEEADFAYLGDGTVTFKVEIEKGIFCNYNVTISVEEDNVAFAITEDWQ